MCYGYGSLATVAGSVAVTAAGTGIPTSATQSEIVNAGTPTQLVFTSALQSLGAGACSAAATVQAQDQYGNAWTATSSRTVTLSASPASGFTFYGASGCS